VNASVRFWPKAECAANVRYWPIADISLCTAHVRFEGLADIQSECSHPSQGSGLILNTGCAFADRTLTARLGGECPQ